MLAVGKISACVLAFSLLTIPVFGQGGGRRNASSQVDKRAGGDPARRRPGPHFGDWLRKNLNTPPAQQQKALESDPKFQKLPPDRQDRLRQRLQEFNSLPPDQQQRILDRMEKWEHMTPEQKSRARAVFDRLRTLPDDRRNSIRQQMRAFRGMDMDQRKEVMNSERFKRDFSSDEQDIMKQWLDLRDSDTASASPKMDDDDSRPQP